MGPAGFEIGKGAEIGLTTAEVHGAVGDFSAGHANSEGCVSIGARHADPRNEVAQPGPRSPRGTTAGSEDRRPKSFT